MVGPVHLSSAVSCSALFQAYLLFRQLALNFWLKVRAVPGTKHIRKMQTPAATFFHSVRPGLSADLSKKPKAVGFFIFIPAGWS